MQQFGGKDSKRHFTVVMGDKEHGLYVSSTPSSAAKKAVTKLCTANKSKKVEFSIREITQGSKKKTYGPYEGYIEKLKEPIELKGRVIKYKPVAKLSAKKGVQKGGFIDHFSIVFIGEYREIDNITDEEINKLLKDIDAKIEISRKNIEVTKTRMVIKNSRYLVEEKYIEEKPIELVIKITPNTYSNNKAYLDEIIFELKNRVIDIFSHFFKKKTRPTKSIQIFVRTYTDENEHQNEEITELIKKKLSNNLDKLKLIRISFFVFKNKKIIKLIIDNISKILREQIFFGGEYETQIDNFFIYFIGRTVLKKEQLEKKIENIIEKLKEKIRNQDELTKKLNKDMTDWISESPKDFYKRFQDIQVAETIYKSPFIPIISEYRKNTNNFRELSNNIEGEFLNNQPSAPRLENNNKN
jgi:hypothetical protein